MAVDNPKHRQAGYHELQQLLDQVIGKIGLENVVFLLAGFLQETNIPVDETQKLKMISQYLITESIKVFELTDRMFFTSYIQEYREARMTCFHLIKKYTECSYSKLADDFGLTKRNIMYNCGKCRERLSIPYYYPAFIEKYNTLEKRVIRFISTLGPNSGVILKRVQD